MSFVASNYDKHKKRHSAITAMLKNYLMHDLSCPVPKKTDGANSKFEVAMHS